MPERRRLIRISLNLVPFAGIAFLWFIGVIRDQLGDVEDRLFSTVFLGSGLLFLAMLFSGTVTLTGLMEVVATTDPDVGVYGFGRSTTQTLVSVYAMRMAAVFTLSVSTVGIRTRSLPRWVSYLGYVVALTLMVAAGEHKWTQLVFPTWVLLVSVVLLLVRPPVRSGTPSRLEHPSRLGHRTDHQLVDPYVCRRVEHEQDGRRDVVRRQHHRAGLAVGDLRPQLEEVGVHITRTEVTAPDPVRRLLRVEGLTDRCQCCLGGRVRNAGVRGEPPGRVRGHHDHLTVAGSAHAGQHGVDDPRHRGEVRRHDPLELLDRLVTPVTLGCVETGRQDQIGDRTPGRDDPLVPGRDRCGVEDVQRQRETLPTGFLDEPGRLVDRRCTSPGESHPPASGRGGHRSGAAHPTAGAGDPHDAGSARRRHPRAASSYALPGIWVASLPPLTSISAPVM